MEFLTSDLLPNISFKTSRSSGKGGQHINKVSSKVELNFNFEESALFNGDQKKLLREKLKNKLTADGAIQIKCEEDRSQHVNKERALQKLVLLLKSSFYIKKLRKLTKPKKSSIEKRLQNKQATALKKLYRSNNKHDF